jgi:hypothetical protein
VDLGARLAEGFDSKTCVVETTSILQDVVREEPRIRRGIRDIFGCDSLLHCDGAGKGVTWAVLHCIRNKLGG